LNLQGECKVIKTMLVPLVGLSSDNVTLAIAYAIARLFDSHIDVVHVRPDLGTIGLRTVEYDIGRRIPRILSPERLSSIEESVVATEAAARRAFDDFCAKSDVILVNEPSAVNRVSATYKEVEGEPVRQISADAIVHELTVCGRPSEFSGLGVDRIGEVLILSGRLLLLAPDYVPSRIGSNIAIAWKQTAEAARAVTGAMPLLLKAQRVVILSAVEDGRDADEVMESAGLLADELRWHGLSPEIRCVMPAPDLTAAVMDAAQGVGADLMVMGGYGHSRTRELIFGGFTRRVLREAPIPILLAH
jgi:nucleotide-binding universal stress UspA family protein